MGTPKLNKDVSVVMLDFTRMANKGEKEIDVLISSKDDVLITGGSRIGT